MTDEAAHVIVEFDFNDPENPKNFSKARKWLITMLVASGSLCTTACSSIYISGVTQVQEDFGVSAEVALLPLVFFVLGIALGPLWLAPLSEFYGRNKLYIPSFLLFTIWQIPAALAPNIECLIIVRALAGFCSSGFLCIAGGSVADVWSGDEIHLPMAVYTISPLAGPALGPVIAGFICSFTTWRWIFWVMLIWSGLLTTALFFFLPETFAQEILRRRAAKLRKQKGEARFMAKSEVQKKSLLRTLVFSCTRPFLMLFTEPMLFILDTYCSVILGIVYLFFESFPLVFGKNHGFNLWQVGLSFVGLGIGDVLSLLLEPLWTRIFNRASQRDRENGGDGKLAVEWQLAPMLLGSVLIPISLFWFAFTSYPTVHWIVPIIASIPFGTGLVLTYASVFQYLVRAYPMYAASAMSSNTFERCIFACVFPLFATQMYERLGYEWASALLAFIMVALVRVSLFVNHINILGSISLPVFLQRCFIKEEVSLLSDFVKYK